MDLYSLVIVFWVITSWFPRMRRHELVQMVGKLCEPPLRLARRVIPTAGGFDFSPIMVIVLLQLLAGALRRLPL